MRFKSKGMFIRFTILIFSLLLSVAAVAQNGTIAGKVLDAKTQEGIIGANVYIEGTQVGSSTDMEGNFIISNVKPGTYNIIASFVTYKTQQLVDVVVEPGKRTDLTIPMQEESTELEEVVVTATREINNDFSLVNAIKESKLVVSGISAEQITRLPDRDAAQIMQRVSGVTIADNRFVLIRGVPERYNQVMINGIIGPSTEIDRRSFSFDLIPAGAIDQMLIYKSASPEIPGDFAGGVVKLITKKAGDEKFFNVGISSGFRTNTTFQDYASSQTSGTDIFGYDDGFRAIPSGFPSTNILKNSARNSNIRQTAGKSLTNNFDYTKTQAPVDYGANFSLSLPFRALGMNINNITVVSYSNSYLHYEADFRRYNSFTATSADTRFEYTDNFYSRNVRLNAMNNWLFKVSDKFTLEFKNLFVQLGENETTLRTGFDKLQSPNFDRRNYAYHYLSRKIYTGQLEGAHTLNEDGSAKLDWVIGYNNVNRNEPDYRRFRTVRENTAAENDPFLMQLPSAGNLFETGRFWSTLQDEGVSGGLNFEKKFGEKDDKRAASIKAGGFYESKSRSFNARYLNYLYPGGADFDPAIGEQLRALPLSDIFAPENIKKSDGFVIEEGTTLQDKYTGTNKLFTAYAGASKPMGSFDVNVGVRYENNVQTLKSKDGSGADINVNNPVSAFLPSFNVAYNISDRSLARIAYGRTVNRPEFRELAPFLYYQFEYETAIFGNEDLKTAFINNFDVRYELYPNPGETFSVGGFYKDFKDPIETYLQITAENPQQRYGNAPSATSYGIELEFRKSLASLGVNKFLRNTSFNLNTSFIKSKVDIGSGATNQINNRPLQGQSPYIVNFGLYYNDTDKGFSVNLAYNVFGPRIFSVGDKLFPSWWELPRNSVDLQLSKQLGKKLELKVNAQNLLNATYRIYQDNNNNNKIVIDEEAVIREYQVGTQFSIGLSWKVLGTAAGE